MTGLAGIRSVAVVGGGFMGSGIAESVAVAGLPVILRDIDERRLERARQEVDRSLDRAVAGGKLDESHAHVARGRIELTTDLARIGHAGLVIEAVPEDHRRKLEVMRAIDEVARDREVVRGAHRQAFDRDQGPLRVHRQHAAGPLPDGGRPDVRGRVRRA